jgi:hypothetical protein
MAAFCYGVTTDMRSNEIISYMEMCTRERLSLQRGMNFNATETHSIVLSSHRPGAPYDEWHCSDL